METWLTSDLHLSHENIIKYTNRPWKNSIEMDKALIENWNKVVSKDDLIYVLGDFSMRGRDHYLWFEKTLSVLQGRKVLILGNHDKLGALKYVELGFESVHTSLFVEGVFLAHDPALATCLPKNTHMFCGHVHNLFLYAGSNSNRVVNVGVDVWGYCPVKFRNAFNFLISKDREYG